MTDDAELIKILDKITTGPQVDITLPGGPTFSIRYQTLHYDCDPILFTGFNLSGDRVLGSLMWDDEDNGSVYNLFTLVSPEEFEKFANLEISYREILDNSKNVWISKRYNFSEIRTFYRIDLHELPEDILPTYDSFLPAKYEEQPEEEGG
jgi:hypothetical protein